MTFLNGGNVGINSATPGQKLDVAGNIKLDDNIMVEGNSSARVYRNLVTYSDNTSGSAGIFIINTTMPWNSACMFRLKVEGYFYDASGPFETTIGAYMYTDNNIYNKGYTNTGAKNLPVRIGRNASGNVAIIIGTDGATYEYPKISVTSYMQMYSSINEAAADGWTITRATNTGALTFVQSVPEVTIVPARVIMLWSGSTGSIPLGWALCNGSNGTPDLRNRFIVGAGNTYAVGATGGATTVTLAVGNLPSHTHTYSDGFFSENSRSTNNANITLWDIPEQGNNIPGSGNSDNDNQYVYQYNGRVTSATGSGTAFNILPPYYALCYIMKL